MSTTERKLASVVLHQSRITKNTVRFDAPDGPDPFTQPPVTTLYVAKGLFAQLGHFPESITITISTEASSND